MGTLIDVPAHSFSVMGRGSTQEPPCRFLHFHCTVAAIYVGWRFICRFLESGFIYVRYFRKTYTLFAKYNHEIYSKSNYLGLLHVTGLSSWWVSSKIIKDPILSSVCVCVFFCLCSVRKCLENTQVSSWWSLRCGFVAGVHAGQQLMVKNPMDGSSFLITVPLGTGPGLQANHLEIARLMQKNAQKTKKNCTQGTLVVRVWALFVYVARQVSIHPFLQLRMLCIDFAAPADSYLPIE